MIINYDCKTFIVQATDLLISRLLESVYFKELIVYGFIVSKVPKWDNLVLRSADFYFSIVINFCSELLLYLYSNGKKGK
jgi:hypothetical protein